jgi:hypothetical protein
MDPVTRDGLTLAPNWLSTKADEHSLNNQSWWYEYLPARYSKGRMVTPPGVRLSVATPHALGRSILVVREDAWDRAAKGLGLCHEFQTGAPDIDATLMLSGDLGDDLPMFFQPPATQRALSTLFERAFDRVEFFGNRISATCRPWSADLADSNPPPTLVEVAGALLKLSAGLSLVPDSAASPGARFHHAVAAPSPAAWTVGGVLAAGAVIFGTSLMSFLSAGELIARLGGWAVAVGAVAVMVFAAACRRFAFRGRTIAAVAFAVFALAASGTLLTLAVLNESWDSSPPVEHSELVTGKRVTGSKSRSYKISTLSWRPDHRFEEFALPNSVWIRAAPGSSHYVVHSRAGFFHVEWLQDRRLIP